MKTDRFKKMYFLGIGGIGMSALARYFHNQGTEIHGYDLTPSKLTDALAKEGMYIHFDENIQKIPADIDLSVYTPAIPATNKEFIFLKQKNIPLLKRAELIETISSEYFTIAVGGTHGKTSISAITSHIFKSTGMNITALVGGICKNYHSNLILSKKTDFFLIEADEFDHSFLRLKPQIAVVSSMDADHLDIYGNQEELKKNYLAFVNNIVEGGLLVYNRKLSELDQYTGKKINYGIDPKADIKATNIQIIKGKFCFDIITGKALIKQVTMQIPGFHYIENALAATAIALNAGLTEIQIRTGLESFTGVERRFEYHINTPELVYIDDYAHHPEEIRVTIEAARKLYPGKKLTGIFQPHLFSRTRDFAAGFAESLDKLDEIILLDIYPARELPIAGISANIILELMKNPNRQLFKKEEMYSFLSKFKSGVLITIGAGDIGMMTEKITNILLQR